MKRKLAAVLLAVSMLCACGSQSSSSLTMSDKNAGQEDAAAQGEEEGDQSSDGTGSDQTGNDQTETGDANGSKAGSSSQKDLSQPSATIEETVLIDESDIKVTAKSLDYENGNAVVSLLLENNTDQDLSFLCGTLGYSMNAVNGYTISDGYMNADVSAGMKSNEEICFDLDELALYGISEIAEIDLGIYVQDENYDDFMTPDTVSILTSAYETYDFSKDTLKEAITDGTWESQLGKGLDCVDTEASAEQNGAAVTAVLMFENNYGERCIAFELENTTDSLLSMASANVTLNGLIIQSGRWSSLKLAGGNRGLLTFSLDDMIDPEFETLVDPDQVGTFSFDLEFYGDDGWDAENASVISYTFDESVPDVSPSGTPVYEGHNITIYALPAAEDEYGYEYLLPLLVVNNYGETVYISDSLDSSFSINGYMADQITWGLEIEDGKMGIMTIEISQDDAEDLEINSLEDLQAAENKQITLEIREDESYEEIDSPKITF